MLHQLIKPPEPKSEPNQHYKFHSSSTTKQIDVGLFSLGGFHLADEGILDKADLPEVLRVPDVLLRRLSDGERLPLALVKLVRQCVAGQGDAVSSPAEMRMARSNLLQRPALRGSQT